MDFNPVALDIVWTLLATVLVFLMQAGFSLLEAGATRAKNSINIIMKNIMDMSLGSLVFWLVGFGFMFGTNSSGGIGTDNFLLSNIDPASETGYFDFAFFIFQTVIAATAATIISGEVAERKAERQSQITIARQPEQNHKNNFQIELKYVDGEPVIKEFSKELSQEYRDDSLYQVSEEVEQVMWDEKKLFPNADFSSLLRDLSIGLNFLSPDVLGNSSLLIPISKLKLFL